LKEYGLQSKETKARGFVRPLLKQLMAVEEEEHALCQSLMSAERRSVMKVISIA